MKSDIPGICDIIGVNINQRFIAEDGMGGLLDLIVDKNGDVRYSHSGAMISGTYLCRILNNLNGVHTTSSLTAEEIELCRRIGANYVSRDESDSVYCQSVYFWSVKPECDDGCYYNRDDCVEVAILPAHVMPSLLYGQCLFVGERRVE